MEPRIEQFGANGVLFRWSDRITEQTYREILALDEYLKEEYSSELIETVSAYTSLAVFLKEDLDVLAFMDHFEWRSSSSENQASKSIVYEIPVCYEPQFAADLPLVANHCRLTENEVIQLHTSVTYDVRFIGFLPGFAYLSGLDRRLHMPRNNEPRKRILKGSVGIGGEQTGIYPQDSPGGWNIIGSCPLRFFNVKEQIPSLLAPGDRVTFRAISAGEFEEIEHQVCRGTYKLRTV